MSAPTRKMRVAPGEHGRTLQEFIVQRLGLSRGQAKRLIDDRCIFINQQRVWMARHELMVDDTVEVIHAVRERDVAQSAPRAVRILHEDDDYLIVDKPAGYVANGGDSVEAFLQQQLGKPALQAVHRLDRETSGCLLFAFNQEAVDAMIEVFQQREVLKVYLAIVRGFVPVGLHRIDAPIEGQSALTHVKVRKSTDVASLVELRLDTGRTHQIRRHLSGVAHPLVGDKQYETREVRSEALRRVPRQMLHALRLGFKHPRSGVEVQAEAPIPADFRDTMKALRLG